MGQWQRLLIFGILMVPDDGVLAASDENLEGAIKLFLAAKGSLAPGDITKGSSILPRKRGKHGVLLRHQTMLCDIEDGCVSAQSKINYLTNKFIPKGDGNGHLFRGTENPAAINEDFKSYLLSRPSVALPEVVKPS